MSQTNTNKNTTNLYETKMQPRMIIKEKCQQNKNNEMWQHYQKILFYKFINENFQQF